eukprot:TRINITY_DN5056_c0_g1_i5.p1 TRINITY_DN5056_c0_g1~~TRINITY_DN5056_c0_g1_i5.p1  ORF type:complete len:255 (-),score=51.04 TRINITY_DN5056_c0_g1_i5:156-920(-)
MLVEYSIPMPFDVALFQVGQRYATIQALKAQKSEDPNSAELLESREYHDAQHDCTGQYTQTRYNAGSKLPSWVNKFVSKDMVVVFEESWNCYPHFQRTLFTVNTMQKKVSISVLSRYLPGGSRVPNPFNLSPSRRKHCMKETIDFAADDLGSYYSTAIDPGLVEHSEGPYRGGWQEKVKSQMLAVKLVEIKVSVPGVSRMAEQMLQRYIRSVLLRNTCMAVCTLDEWEGMSLCEVQAIEDEELPKASSIPRSRL